MTTMPPSAMDADEKFVRAANSKDYSAMDEALSAGANVDVANVRGITVLHAAVMARHLEIAQWLIKRGANPAIRNHSGDSALHDAAKLADSQLLQALLGKTAAVDVENTLGSTPLMEAAGARRAESVRLLLGAGAKASHKSKHGTSALLIAAGRHDPESVKLLLGKGANPNETDSYGVSALISAASVYGHFDVNDDEGGPMVGSLKVVAALLAAGANVNHAAKSGNTALAEASKSMNRRGMVALLEAGADPNVHTTAGASGEMTPLMIAAYRNDLDLMQMILDRKADVNYSNPEGQSALDFAMRAPVDSAKKQAAAQAAIGVLLKAGARFSSGGKNAKGSLSLVHYGVITESLDLLRTAKEQGGLDHPGESDATAIFYAVAMRKMEMLRALKDLGANMGALNNVGQNTLHILAEAPYPKQVVQAIEMMKKCDDEKYRAEAARLEGQTQAAALDFTRTLVEAGVDINGADKNGNTPLHLALGSFAAGRVDRKYLEFLVGQGADVSKRNENEESCFVRALKLGDLVLVETWAKLLIERGQAKEVEMAVYDAAWSPPELASQVLAMKIAFERILPLGARIDYQDDDGQFPLLIAAAQNQEDLVKALLDMGAIVDQVNHEGETAAFHTIKENHANVTQVLFDHGANPDAVRKDGESLLTIAYRNHRGTAVQQIVDARPKWLDRNAEAAVELGGGAKKMSM